MNSLPLMANYSCNVFDKHELMESTISNSRHDSLKACAM